jgi:hypothetical protein
MASAASPVRPTGTASGQDARRRWSDVVRKPAAGSCSTAPEAGGRVGAPAGPVGARRAGVAERCHHVGRTGWSGEVPWVVLADPEGNEFCVLGPLAANA